ncbi:MAG: CoA transferase, partial [Proteobacteria bacterium]|nr:CoA transferase [Pseudomonadota bacterium]
MPLANVKVLDLTRFVAGPFCTLLLADMGAEVIKIESPGRGDETRYQGTTINGESWYFVGMNRNKKSLTLDLKAKEGKEIFLRLAREFDVVVENFRPGVMRNLGLDYNILREVNPAIIYCGISGYGKDGPYHLRPAFDFIAQGISGFMSITGFPDREPVRTGIPISDSVAGIYGAYGILSALIARQHTGKGQEVQTSLVDGMISILSFQADRYFGLGEIPEPGGNDHPVASPYGTFKAKDGYINIAPAGDPMWERLAHALGLKELLADPRFQTNDLRRQHRRELNEIVNEITRKRTMAEWIEHLNKEGIPCGPIYNLEQTFQDPQVRHQEMVLDLDQPSGKVKTLGFPVKMSHTPAKLRRPAPQLGQHTMEILASLQYSPEQVNSRQGDLRPPCTLAFSGGAFTPPSTKGLRRPFGNPAIGSPQQAA